MKMPFRFTLSIALTSLLVACGSTPSERIGRNYVNTNASSAIEDLPKIGVEMTTELGESLVQKVRKYSAPAVELSERVEFPTSNLGKSFTLTLLPGQYIRSGKDETGTFYEANKKNLLTGGKQFDSDVTGGIYANDSDLSKADVWLKATSTTAKVLNFPSPPLSLKRTLAEWQDDLSFKRELVYAGLSQNIITIQYREFKNDFARPAFSQDLRYDLNESKVIGYKGARFEVVRATNQGLTYKVLKYLD
jgi:hypothetical protein